MKDVKRKQNYIVFLLGMAIVMMLCFGLVCVIAEPTDTEDLEQPGETTEAPLEESTETPADSATDLPMETPTNTPEETPSQAPIITPTEAPTETEADPTPSAGEITATPEETIPVESLPTETISPTPMDTTPPFTMGPINQEDLLPENSPQITPGKTESDADTPLNMNGYVLRIAATWDEYQDPCLDLEAIRAFEQKYNCKVQFLDLSKETLYNRLLMSCATGITYFDAILVEGTELLVNMEPLGLLQAFSQYMTEEEISALPISYQKFLSKGNVLYGIPAKAPDVAGIWHNTAMVTAYEYTSPLPFYEEGSWTWYQLTSLFKEATQDINNDGYYDTYGIATSSPWYFSVLESVRGSLFRWDGIQFLPGGINAVTVHGLSFERKVYANHYVASDYERYFYTGKTPYLAGEISMYSELTYYMKKENLLFLPYPSESGTEPYMTVATSVPCAAITATATYPEQTAELLKILYGGDKLATRIETYCTQSGFSKQVKTAYFKMLENFTVDFTTAFDPSGTIEATVQSFLKNRTPTVSSVQKFVQPLLEKAIAQKQKEVDLTKVPVQIQW